MPPKKGPSNKPKKAQPVSQPAAAEVLPNAVDAQLLSALGVLLDVAASQIPVAPTCTALTSLLKTKEPEESAAPSSKPPPPVQPPALPLADKLKSVFDNFASYGAGSVAAQEKAAAAGLDNSHFAKLCKDCSLVDARFTLTDVDLLFNRVKAKGDRRITFEQFRDGVLPEIASKKGAETSAIAEQCIATGGPKAHHVTATENVRFYDKKDDEATKDQTAAKERRVSEAPSVQDSRATTPRKESKPALTEADIKLKSVFDNFASYGAGSVAAQEKAAAAGLDNSHFAKLCKDCSLVDARFTLTDVDLLFNRVKAKGDRRITFEQFRDGVLPEIASKKGAETSAIAEQCIATGGPKAHHVTATENVRFYDKKDDDATRAERRLSLTMDTNASSVHQSRSTTPRKESKPALTEADIKLKSVFDNFASYGAGSVAAQEKAAAAGLDNSHFAKLCKDCSLVDARFTLTDVDLLFNRVKAKGDRRITFEQFRDGVLPEIASKKGAETSAIAEQCIASDGPKAVRAISPPTRHKKVILPFLQILISESHDLAPAAAFVLQCAAEKDHKRHHKIAGPVAAAGAHDALLQRSRSFALGPVMRTRDKETFADIRRGPLSSSDEEAKSKIEQLKRMQRRMRDDRELAESSRREAEQQASSKAEKARLQLEAEARAERERQLRERLENLRARRENRELEFLVGERRAQQVLRTKTLDEIILEKYHAQQQKDEEERAQALRQRSERMRQPVLVGLDEANLALQEVAERIKRRREEIRDAMREVEVSQPRHYQGRSYGFAVQEYVKHKHIFDDVRHEKLYRFAKRGEYGKLVKHLPLADNRNIQRSQQRSHSQPDGSSDQSPFSNSKRLVSLAHTPSFRIEATQPKQSSTIADRCKMGNQYLREAISEKKPLPPGLRLQPITEVEIVAKQREQERDRKRKGDVYLREIRSLPRVNEVHVKDDAEYAAELRVLRHQACLKEQRLLSSKVVNDEDEDTAVQLNEQYLDVVMTKMQLLKKIEEEERLREAKGKVRH